MNHFVPFKLRWRAHALGAVLVAAWACTSTAQGQVGIAGDVNRDGDINVLDVQRTVNIALGAELNAPEADVDDNSQVDVLDIQTITNTAIGTGGLRQEIVGSLDPDSKQVRPGDFWLYAVSLDGRVVTAPFDPLSGEFRVRLAVRTSWTLNVIRRSEDGPRLVGTLQFRVADLFTPLLPLPALSRGVPMNLGVLERGAAIEIARDLRTLIAEIGDPISNADDDANGVADVIDDFLQPFLADLFAADLQQAPGLRRVDLIATLRGCLSTDEAPEYFADLSGVEIEGGVPVFLEPVIECVRESIQRWIQEAPVPVSSETATEYEAFTNQWLRTRVRLWLATQVRPELIDSNDDAIPDYLDDQICLVGADGEVTADSPCILDRDGDGFPDYTQDSDGDGVPDVFDRDTSNAADLDGDGIPDDRDLDDDGDGIADYADPEPRVPDENTVIGGMMRPTNTPR